MSKRLMTLSVAVATALGAAFAHAAVVEQELAMSAASGFLAKSSVAKRVLADRSVESVEQRGSLWMQSLTGMSYRPGGSGGTIKLCTEAENYWLDSQKSNPVMSKWRDGHDNLWTAITNDLANATPIQVNSPDPEPVVATTPIAVWHKDFNRTVEGCTLDWHDNTLGDDRSITIQTVDGNEYQGVDVNLASGMNAITVIVKYSGLAYTTDNGRMVFTSCAESTKTTDRTAVRLTTGNVLSGSYGDNSGVAESGTSDYLGTSVPAASGYMVFCYGDATDGNNREL